MSTAKMQEMVTKGLVPANKALPILQTQLDKFYGNADKVDTFSEAWEKFKTDVQSAIGTATLPLFQRLSAAMQGIANGNLGERLADGITRGVEVAMPIMRDLVQIVRDLWTAFGPLITGGIKAGLVALGAAIKVAVDAAKGIAAFGASHATAVQTLTVAVLAGAAAWKAYRTAVATAAAVQVAASILPQVGAFFQLAAGVRSAAAAFALLQAAGLSTVGIIVIIVAAAAALAAGIYFLATRTQFFQTVWAGLKTAGLAVANFFAGPFLTPFKAIGAFFSGPFLTPFKAIGTFFTQTIPSWGNAIAAFFQVLPGRILSLLANLPSMLGNLFLNSMKAAAYALGFGVGLIVGAIIHLPGWIATLFTNMWNTAVRLTTAGVRAVVNFFINLATNTVRLAQQAVTGTIRFFAQLPGQIASLAQRAAQAAISALQSAARGMISAATNAVNSTVRFFQQLPGRAASALRVLPGVVRGAVAGAGTWLLNAGRQIINGLINGIQSGIGRVTSMISNLASKVKSGFADALKIFSPSRVFRDYGRYTAEGFALGVRDKSDLAVKAVTRMAGMTSVAGTATGSAGRNANGSLVGTLNLNGSGDMRSDLAEVNFQLRRIQRGGLYA